LGVGFLAKAPIKIAKEGKVLSKVRGGVSKVKKSVSKAELPEVEEVIKIENRALKAEVKETSPSQVLKDTNPEAAKKVHKVVSEAKTDEAAKAGYGTTKANAVANDLLPEVAEPKGTSKK